MRIVSEWVSKQTKKQTNQQTNKQQQQQQKYHFNRQNFQNEMKKKSNKE